MTIVLNEVEARLLGVLIEKQLTTPEQYPLSIKALVAGSNQKSNRHPVVHFGEAEAHVGAQGLEAKGLANRVPPGMGARVERYEHLARQTLSLDRAELAVVAELLLRGPQQPGELRTRASRMSAIDTLAELGQLLDKLIGVRLVKRLAPSPGTRAERYRELLSSPAAPAGVAATQSSRPLTPEEIVRRHDEQAAARKAQERGESGRADDPAPQQSDPFLAPAAESRPTHPTHDASSDRVSELERRITQLEQRLASLLEKLGEDV
ncbi:DUF480 domain-containing protein [Engelhardtia mirabilis]|uniref:Uncharacterized protein n=1 Tax=Engelhardtia mirabilis TaxID=2528011 RepID=A0A518BFM6_9BACT|nr:hypothetical protein Pla133_08380 [Planctomycetes bacterium Pla133]QDV00098.1 hypothetical protein Pla86_08370 [Planctomycetes bacterium Pla86]